MAGVSFRGGKTCICVATSLPWVELDMLNKGLIRSHIDIYQLGYRSDVGPSAGTHKGGGNTDVGQYSDDHIRVWRDWGWAMQNRAPFFPGNEHAHGWPWGCTHIAREGQYQITDWRNRRNGLAGHGPVRGPYPVDNWRDALERNFYRMFTLADIRNAVVEALHKDGTVPNFVTGNDKNKTIAVDTSLAYIGKRLVDVQTDQAAMQKQLAEILTELRKR